ncbi:MAG: aconitate hydratase [Actinomycetota bacterium]|nr:aconitate hydratase [Actinomycetota bacterium]
MGAPTEERPLSTNSFGARDTLRVGNRAFDLFRLDALQSRFDVARLPFSLKVLLENLLRTEGNGAVDADDVVALASWDAKAEPSKEIAFTPARVVMQDFTGVPAVVDLAAMRDAMAELGSDPARINPLVPAELVIDHSVQVDAFGTPQAFTVNAEREFERNRERYAFLRWGQDAFANFAVVPPDTGIVHQVNLEYLSRVVFVDEARGLAYPDTLVGTDSHTTMVNGLGVLGWGVGGIEAEAAMLGQPMSMLIPQVIGFRLHGELREGATATDLVLTVTELLRARGVVGSFVEFYGDGLANLPLADRATIGNMSPEFGSTCAIFPIDAETLRYLTFSGRPKELVDLVEAYAKEQGLWHDERSEEPTFTDTLALDLADVEPSLAGPKRPQDRVPLAAAKAGFREVLPEYVGEGGGGGDRQPGVPPQGRVEDDSSLSFPASDPPAYGDGDGLPDPPRHPEAEGVPEEREHDAVPVALGEGPTTELDHGHAVIAAITSCTNTSNPSVMLGAGLLARNAVARGLERKPWVKTSLAPGSKVVTEYLERAGLTDDLEALGFHLVGYGCTTCIGNSGPLPDEISQAVNEHDLAVVAVLSGNRNFEGRIHGAIAGAYLASPALVVAWALAGTVLVDLTSQPLALDPDREPVYLADLWPDEEEVSALLERVVTPEEYAAAYSSVTDGGPAWEALPSPTGPLFPWNRRSTYFLKPPFVVSGHVGGEGQQPPARGDLTQARVLVFAGDAVTTDHISPAGPIPAASAAADWLRAHGVEDADLGSFGGRRGNHHVLLRGAFANPRFRNHLVPGLTGGWTKHHPSGDVMPVHEAAQRYRDDGIPVLILAGEDYGMGSSRDWAAKGPHLLGVRAVIAKSFERIHRSNLVGMGIVPLEFQAGQGPDSLGLSGDETFDLTGLLKLEVGGELRMTARRRDGETVFRVRVRVDSATELMWVQHGGSLPAAVGGLISGAAGARHA